MKTRFVMLALVGALCAASSASAAIRIGVGPVRVGVGVGRPVYRPVVAPRPVVARPPVVVPRPVVMPAPLPPVVTTSTEVTAPSDTLPTNAALRAAIRAARIRHAIDAEVKEAVDDALEQASGAANP
jgi:hypothetical protein